MSFGLHDEIKITCFVNTKLTLILQNFSRNLINGLKVSLRKSSLLK